MKLKMEYEPNSFNHFDVLKKQKLVRLIHILASNLRCNWEACLGLKIITESQNKFWYEKSVKQDTTPT